MNAPTLGTGVSSLPPEGAFAARGGPSPPTTLLEVKNLRVAFGGKEVVCGIDFSIGPGEKLALVGESGSGKTVSALSLLRLAHDAHVEGQAIFDGPAGPTDLLSIPERQLRGIRGQDIAMIFQEPMTALNPLFTVGDQIIEVLELKQGIARTESSQAAIKLLATTGIAEPQRRAGAYPHQLSGGQRQRAMIAMALACKPKLLLADEPTTALDVTVRGQILDLLSELQKEYGMAVLMITHDLNLVRRFADRVAVMEAGHIVEHGPVADVFANPRHAYTRKLIDSRPTRDVAEVPPDPARPPVMRASGLQVSYPVPLPGLRGWFKKGEFVAVRGADFSVPAGQTLGVVGESGSGKSTLALAALGLLPHQGQLQAAGHAWSRDAARNKAMRRAVQVVFQDPFSSLSPRLTVEEIVGEGLLVHAPELDANGRRLRVARALAEVGMSADQFPGLPQRYPHEFSGGQRQRLAIARALIIGPQLLVLDEPTSALDVTIQKQVLQLLQRLQREHALSYLLITHDVDVIRAMAHRVIVMKDGEIVESGTVEQVFAAPQHDYTRILVAAAT
ncbi:ABC transporter ATP-binding protein [Rhodoferax sediminis]|uniref:ABC transporter ATP-binding protein n=1 Tax=Rhodoferax sediminis TaxID=2509614 RepID=A0A515DB27_9BURK|nr:dipeptide ABC transporter ATP-binding protein [Rhodoferax sediminis]QDL37596.1 ABC transporter ATP-binding protein [Rhodoferax sediminis]